MINMAGQNRYTLAIKQLTPFDGQVLNVGELRKLIIKQLGSNPNTINGYLKMLRETDVISELPDMRFKITIPKNENHWKN